MGRTLPGLGREWGRRAPASGITAIIINHVSEEGERAQSERIGIETMISSSSPTLPLLFYSMALPVRIYKD